ncbi:MAG TPA: HEPN domain-containing protein [Candidatus Omnitrophota bacterium]|nr:HEPN domain-containing protein [Candidatus Omnitrophota bacterium]
MDTKEKIIYWLSLAHYDLVSAQAMLKSKRFLYVGFLCHQVAEKCLKAHFWHTRKENPPYTHNLLLLSEKSKFDQHADEKQLVLFNELMPLNIQARYPEDKELLLKALSEKKCREFYKKTKEFYLWIKKLLK